MLYPNKELQIFYMMIKGIHVIRVINIKINELIMSWMKIQ